MADEPPVSTTVPETVTVDTGADAATLGDLNASFADFWKEADTQTDGAKTDAPEAPAAPAAKPEAKPEPPKVDEVRPYKPLSEIEAPDTKTEPGPVTATPTKDYSDDEIEKLTLGPNARPEFQADFRKIKDLWKADRVKMEAEVERATRLEQELNAARQNSWTPEARADYENAAQIRRRFEFQSDPEFIEKYQKPIRSNFEAVIDEAVQALPDRQSAEAWGQHIKANFSPDQLSREWWLNSVVAKVPNELERQTLLGSVTQLLRDQRERDAEVTRRTNDKASFDNFISEKAEATKARVQNEIMTEIQTQERQISMILPRDVNSAKTTAERAAIEQHNERFGRLNSHFQKVLGDIASNGPRGWVRAAIEATRTQVLLEENKWYDNELKSVRAERDRLKTDLDKITGARRKLAQTTGTPPMSTTAGKKNGEGLSIKDLDIRKSFDSYNWGDNT